MVGKISEVSSLERTAVHEAGHSSACVLLRVEVLEARIDFADGESKVTYIPSPNPVDTILVAAAGAAAESLAFGSSSELTGTDERNADRAAFAARGGISTADHLVRRCRAEVRELLFDRWDAVEAVALALLECRWPADLGFAFGSLSGREVADLVAGASGG